MCRSASASSGEPMTRAVPTKGGPRGRPRKLQGATRTSGLWRMRLVLANASPVWKYSLPSPTPNHTGLGTASPLFRYVTTTQYRRPRRSSIRPVGASSATRAAFGVRAQSRKRFSSPANRSTHATPLNVASNRREHRDEFVADLSSKGGDSRSHIEKEPPMPKRDAAPVGAPCWVDLFTSDTNKSRTFYGELFGWTAEEAGEEFGGYITFFKDGVGIAGC